MSQIEDQLIQSAYRGARDRLDLPVRLNRKLAELTAAVANADFAPPQQAYQVFDYLSVDIHQQLVALQQVIDDDVAQFANLVNDLGHPGHCDVSGRSTAPPANTDGDSAITEPLAF